MTTPDIILAKEQHTLDFHAGHTPQARVQGGAVVRFETGDIAYERLSKGEALEAIGLETFNRVTGPLYVEGAEPGDALRVELLDVEIHRSWSVWLPGFGGLGGYTQETIARQIPLEDGFAVISPRIRVPLEPMIGCIGLAPAEGVGSTFMPAYHWGGNMDLREMSPGTTVDLPVEVPGALLSIGDHHAAMGRGEPTWVALESAGASTVRVSVVKGAGISHPVLRRDGTILFAGMGADLATAHQHAVDRAWAYLVGERGLEPFEAYAYASAKLEMRLGGPASPIVLACLPEALD
ncbi:MAG: acetamidase/formamidase family protein [Chloroflexi bacterium]|nr:acetamidase/formamidase family protein [Chloroflexota bacterium]